MANRKVKLDPETNAKLRQIAAKRGLGVQDVVDRVLQVCLAEYERGGSLEELLKRKLSKIDDMLAGLEPRPRRRLM